MFEFFLSVTRRNMAIPAERNQKFSLRTKTLPPLLFSRPLCRIETRRPRMEGRKEEFPSPSLSKQASSGQDIKSTKASCFLAGPLLGFPYMFGEKTPLVSSVESGEVGGEQKLVGRGRGGRSVSVASLLAVKG